MNNLINNPRPSRLAVFLATSGHSGVDRIMGLLLPHIASRGIHVDLLHVKGKGPHLPSDIENLRIIELGTSHSFTSLIPVVRYLKKERPVALLSDKDRVNQIAIIARWLAGVPTRVVVRSGTTISKALESRTKLERIRHYLSMRYLYRYADAIVTASKGSAEDLSRFAGIPLGDISIVPNPVNQQDLLKLAAEPVSHPWFERSGVPVIVGLGELGGSKDYETMIRAFSILRRDRAAKLFIIGSGRRKYRLQELVDDLNLKEYVEFFGFTENPFPFLGRADLFVLSSRYEGFGMALLEALSLGIPTVATDCPSGPAEITGHGRFGKLVPVADPEAMAGAMAQSLDSPPHPDLVKQAATPYLLERVADQYLNVLGINHAPTELPRTP